MSKKNILLIYPKSGKYDAFIKDLPLSVLYAARVCLKEGYEVKIIDQRLEPDWKKTVSEELKKRPLLVGVSVMTGKPIHYAFEVSKYVRENSRSPIVWGGIHPTILPDSTIKSADIDFVVRGYGEIPLFELARALERGEKDFSAIKSISYRRDGRIINNERKYDLDMHNLPEVPYNLVDVDKYMRFDGEDRVFSVITSFGCPHKCRFCYYPSYNKRVWWPQTAEQAIGQLSKIIDAYNPTYFSVIDNDFFVDLERARKIFEAIKEKNWKVKFGFRGVRIDELDRMPEDLLALMERINVKHLHIGAESGSQKILNLMDKKITVDQIIRVNNKLKKFPGLLPTYNFFSGLPTEDENDIHETTALILKLLKDNPHCQITAFNQFTPYPGTELYDMAVKHGFKPPESLEGWIDFDEEDCAKNNPWIDPKRQLLLDTLYLTGLFIDSKLNKHFTSNRLKFRALRTAADLYRPLARFRFKRHFTAFPVECYFKKAINAAFN
ncbi:MAG: radical SAM protein [Candidatus Omnitrophica bacterium]|nr:radical SAM protein [Candidatus Omnitrophota bacterium]